MPSAPPGGVLAEQVRQPFRGHAPAFVGDRDRDVRTVAHRRHQDGGGLGRVPGGVGEQVVQDLHDAPAVGHHQRQIRRQVDEDGVAAAAAQERVPCPFHQGGHLRGLGRDRQRARLDAPRIEQIADEAAHVVGLLVDDAEELAGLGGVQLGRGRQHGRGRALDGGQRRP